MTQDIQPQTACLAQDAKQRLCSTAVMVGGDPAPCGASQGWPSSSMVPKRPCFPRWVCVSEMRTKDNGSEVTGSLEYTLRYFTHKKSKCGQILVVEYCQFQRDR